jgi:hypothetical protein
MEIMENIKKEICHICGKESEEYFKGFITLTIPDEKMEEKINKWGRSTWWVNAERTDLSEEDQLEIGQLLAYDQALNTVGRGIICSKCSEEENRLYSKYYPHML